MKLIFEFGVVLGGMAVASVCKGSISGWLVSITLAQEVNA